ncbi:Myristoyl-CoA:protein N-myristoyltransferase, N-terminal domain-containing protein [Polychytrium aggregatum]|uniref:Myristoyl-CoA:protein N-myristoyltransferase, N-terminal domain-containing protein n=1 Tax=Polychytrium aggregatum TaxID=110093 RepID=UPI0022FE7658|nr:Myristoyl-CoA:protein N-myristoyltransferase, N-terminal domain-containing protein [Polychytrium aggregatum]KAI9209853.1 Myristoyl-CoA:protein N-myristoyltransferase, N-terminal domain-containing protein [Polychytrium aggregatum]
MSSGEGKQTKDAKGTGSSKGQAKKNKAASSEASVPPSAPAAPAASGPSNPSAVSDLQIQNLLQMLQASARTEEPVSRRGAKSMDEYKFWRTQPVPRTDEVIVDNGPIEADKPKDEIRAQPYNLPKDFAWCTMDIENEAEMKEVYELLTYNYVEDDDAMFRFDYSAAFLKWALKPPGWKASWHVGVRVASSKKLVAFISAIPAELRIYDHHQQLVEINFLCVHKKLRSKRLAPVLIKEITRRVHLEGIFQATYTAGSYLPKPVSICRYYHRSLNPKKLIEAKFSHLARNMTMAGTIRLYRLPEKPLTPGFRSMTQQDVPSVVNLLKEYLSQYDLSISMNEHEVAHWFLPVPEVVYSYVVENPETGKVEQFVSFYALNSSIIGHPVHKSINAAYLFYYAPKDQGNDTAAKQALIKDALIMARDHGYDVFNCLDLMGNMSFLEELKFGKGDGNLHYYLYNYRCRDVSPEKMALVLL